MKIPNEDWRAVKWWAKKKGVTTNVIMANAIWAYLLPVRADAP